MIFEKFDLSFEVVLTCSKRKSENDFDVTNVKLIVPPETVDFLGVMPNGLIHPKAQHLIAIGLARIAAQSAFDLQQNSSSDIKKWFTHLFEVTYDGFTKGNYVSKTEKHLNANPTPDDRHEQN